MKTLNRMIGLSAVVLWSGTSLAQGGQAPRPDPGRPNGPAALQETPVVDAEAEAGENGPAPSGPLDDERAATEREAAMRSYALGVPGQAVSALQRLIVACADSAMCSQAAEAELMFRLGIALSASPNRRADSVRAFRQALVASPHLDLEPRWASPEAAVLLREARATLPTHREPLATASTASAPDMSQGQVVGQEGEGEEAARTGEKETQSPEGHVAFLAHVNVQSGYGVAHEPQYQTDDISVGQVGGSLTAAVMPSDSRFAIAGRGRASALFTENGTYLLSGADILFGSILGPRQNDNFGYLLFGPGIEYVPQVGDLGASGHGIMGWSYRHISFGAACDFGGAGDYGYFNLGVHLGYGMLR